MALLIMIEPNQSDTTQGKQKAADRHDQRL